MVKDARWGSKEGSLYVRGGTNVGSASEGENSEWGGGSELEFYFPPLPFRTLRNTSNIVS